MIANTKFDIDDLILNTFTKIFYKNFFCNPKISGDCEMKYLVTGCAGFVGSSLVDRLLQSGHEVIGVDNYSTGKRRYVEQSTKHKNFLFYEGDLKQENYLNDKLENVDAIYHFSANADIRDGMKYPDKDLKENTQVTFNVLESMRLKNTKRIIFASSAAALGEPDVFPTPENCFIPAQTSLYGASKMACEGLISAYCQAYGFEGYSFRFVSLLGPRYPHGHVFDFVRKLRADPSRLKILGDGQQRKSYLHINDCINALIHICEIKKTALHSGNNYEVYHLGYPEFCYVKQSAEWICEEMELSPKFEYSGGDRGWVGDNPFVFLDISKANRTGWVPQINIEESIRETTRWLNNNTWIFEE